MPGRTAVTDPLGRSGPVTAYYDVHDATHVSTLAGLRRCLNSPDAVTLDANLRSELERRFTEATQSRLAQEQKAAEDRRKSHLSSLTEEVRQLLIEAAYIELALAANRALFDEALPLDFSEQAYQRLKRHKVPFAGALKIAGTRLPRPCPDDAPYLRYRDSKKDVLHRRFDAIRSKLTDRLTLKHELHA